MAVSVQLHDFTAVHEKWENMVIARTHRQHTLQQFIVLYHEILHHANCQLGSHGKQATFGMLAS